MSSDSSAWEEKKLSDVCVPDGGVQTGPFGSQLHAEDYVEDGVPAVMPVNIVDGRVNETGIARITPADAERLSRYLLRPGDIVYSRRGDVTRCARVGPHEEGWLCGTGCLRVRPDPSKVEPDFVFRHLCAPGTRAWIQGMAVGTSMPNLNTAILSDVPLMLPPADEQHRIAGVLNRLDDTASLQARMERRLLDIADTLFSHICRRADLAGVAAAPLSALVCINPRVRITRHAVTPFVEMASVAPWAIRPDAIGERPYSGGSKFEPDDTLLAKITPCTEHGKGAFADFIDGPAAGSTEFHVLRAGGRLTPETVFLLSRREAVRQSLIARMTGSSGRQRVPSDAFDAIEVVVPEARETWRDEATAIEQLFSLSRNCWAHRRRLISVRDILLPKLVSGSLSVADSYQPDDGFDDQWPTSDARRARNHLGEAAAA